MKPTLLLLALLALPAAAQSPGTVCTGLGEDGRAEAALVPHTLKLVFAQADGHYLGAVSTRVLAADGTLAAEATCDGPWLLLTLAPGRYRVEATFQGRTQTRAVTVTRAPAEQTLRF